MLHKPTRKLRIRKNENSFKMAKMADIVLMIVVWINIYKGTAYMTPYKTTWENAISNCTIETPTIIFKGTEQDLSVAVNATIIGNEEVWVGYYLAATAFHYVGCIKTRDMDAIADFKYNTPGLCYSACNKTNLIGVSISKCYCLNNTIPSDRTHLLCTEGCNSQKNIACGSNNYMSIYITDSYAKSYSGVWRCLRYEFNGDISTLKWTGCNSDNQIICTFNDTSIHKAYNYNESRVGTWRDAMNTCFRLSKLPTSIKDLEHLERETIHGRSWTGVISSEVIYKSDYKAPYITQKGYGYGYLQRNEKNNDIVLKFDTNSTIQRYTLCENDKTTETTFFTTTSEKIRTMTSNKQTTESTKKSDDDKFSQTTTTKITTPGKNTQPKAQQESVAKASDVGIPVGVSVACVITVFTVSVGVILIKRGKVPCMCCRISLPDKSSKCTMNASIVNNSNTIPLECPNGKVAGVGPQTNIVSEYDVLENNGHLPHDYFILEKTEADKNTTVVQDEVNVYNTLASNLKQEANFDNTYDTAEKAAMKLKTKHRVKDDSDANETLQDEDPYNHLNEGERQLKTVRTDNVYGVTQDDEYANCRKIHGKYLQDVEDTYNHTNILQDVKAVEDTYNHTNVSQDVEDDTYNNTT